MKKDSPYSTRPGTVYKNDSSTFVNYKIDVIFYLGTGGGHFAKVKEYNSDGSAKTIYSKWGPWELIRSNGEDPFGSFYGSPQHYYH